MNNNCALHKNLLNAYEKMGFGGKPFYRADPFKHLLHPSTLLSDIYSVSRNTNNHKEPYPFKGFGCSVDHSNDMNLFICTAGKYSKGSKPPDSILQSKNYFILWQGKEIYWI